MSRIHLKGLEIRELFERSFDLKLDNLSDGVTVVYGPNASGKSSLASASARVFCTRLTSTTDHVRASISWGGSDIAVELRGPRSANGAPQSSRPGLYMLSISDLIAGPNSEDTGLIREALSGGLDLDKCLPTNKKNKPDLERPRHAVEERRRRASEVVGHERLLDDLERQKEQAEGAKSDFDVLERRIAAAQAEADAADLERRALAIEETQPGIAQQREGAAGEIRDALTLVDEAREALDLATAALDGYQSKQAERPLDANERSEIERLAGEIRRVQGLGEGSAQAIRDVETRMRNIRAELPAQGKAKLPVDPATRQMLDQLVASVRSAKSGSEKAFAAEAERRLVMDGVRRQFEQSGGSPEGAEGIDTSEDRIAQALELDKAVDRVLDELHRASSKFTDAINKEAAARSDLPYLHDYLSPGTVILLLQSEPPVEDLADRARSLKVELDARERIVGDLEALAAELDKGSAERDQAAKSLADWLEATPGGQAPKKSIPAMVALALGVVALVVWLTASPFIGAGIGVMGLLAVGAWMLFGKAEVAGDRQGDIAGQVPDAWRPRQWTASEVSAKLEEALGQVAQAKANEVGLIRARERADRSEWDAAQNRLSSRLNSLRQETGFDFQHPNEMGLLVRRLARLQEEITSVEAAERNQDVATLALDDAKTARSGFLSEVGVQVQTGKAFETLARACAQYLDSKGSHDEALKATVEAKQAVEKAESALAEFFSGLGWPAEGDPDKAREQFISWLDASEDLDAAERELEAKRVEAADIVAGMSERNSRLSELFEAHGYAVPANPIDGVEPFFRWFSLSAAVRTCTTTLDSRMASLVSKLNLCGVPEEGDLESRCEVPARREEDAKRYRELQSKASEIRGYAKTQRRGGDLQVLQRYELDESADLDRLEAVKNKLEGQAGRFDELNDEISRIKAEVNEAMKGIGLEQAQKSLDDAIASSLTWLNLMAGRAANEIVKAAIETATRQENTTPVIESSNRWLERFTHHRYGSLKEQPGLKKDKVLTVEDRDDNRVKTIGQLSTGTKVHVALAVRLAVIEQAEEVQQTRFPLFLDEVTATSDPQARTAIAQAIGEISKERQVIVLTNRPDDVQLLAEVLGEDPKQVVLPGGQPVPVTPRPSTPKFEDNLFGSGLPLHSTVRRWRADLVRDVLEWPYPEDGALVGEVLRALGTESDQAIVNVLESLRMEVAKSYRQVEWSAISDLVSPEMSDKVRLAWESTRTDPLAFVTAVDKIKGRRAAMVERIQERLDELGLLSEVSAPSRDQLVRMAEAELPASLRHHAGRLTDIFRDYL